MLRGRSRTLLWPLLILTLIAACVGVDPASSDQPRPEDSGGRPASSDEAGLEDSGRVPASSDHHEIEQPDQPPPKIDDPVSDAELRDLQTIANRKGISLQEAIDRYAWRDNFSLAVSLVRESSPESVAGAEIVDGDNAWIAFKGSAPEAALEVIDTFRRSHSGITVEVRAEAAFTEKELQKGIPAVHYTVFESPEVLNATTSHDSTTGKITTRVVLEETAPDSVLDDLRIAAEQSLVDATREDILDSVGVSVVRSTRPVLGGD